MRAVCSSAGMSPHLRAAAGCAAGLTTDEDDYDPEAPEEQPAEEPGVGSPAVSNGHAEEADPGTSSGPGTAGRLVRRQQGSQPEPEAAPDVNMEDLFDDDLGDEPAEGAQPEPPSGEGRRRVLLDESDDE